MDSGTNQTQDHGRHELKRGELESFLDLARRRDQAYWELQRTALQASMTLLSVGAPLLVASGVSGTPRALMGASLGFAALGALCGFRLLYGPFRLRRAMVEEAARYLETRDGCGTFLSRLSRAEVAAGWLLDGATFLSFLLLIVAAFL